MRDFYRIPEWKVPKVWKWYQISWWRTSHWHLENRWRFIRNNHRLRSVFWVRKWVLCTKSRRFPILRFGPLQSGVLLRFRSKQRKDFSESFLWTKIPEFGRFAWVLVWGLKLLWTISVWRVFSGLLLCRPDFLACSIQ